MCYKMLQIGGEIKFRLLLILVGDPEIHGGKDKITRSYYSVASISVTDM